MPHGGGSKDRTSLPRRSRRGKRQLLTIMVKAGIERIAILPSELKPGESQRASGLIVQEEHHDSLKRGVVTDVGPEVPLFTTGMTVYYHCGLKVEDVEIVHVSHVEGYSDE